MLVGGGGMIGGGRCGGRPGGGGGVKRERGGRRRGRCLRHSFDDVKSCHGYEVALYLADQYWYIPVSALAGPTGPNKTGPGPPQRAARVNSQFNEIAHISGINHHPIPRSLLLLFSGYL